MIIFIKKKLSQYDGFENKVGCELTKVLDGCSPVATLIFGQIEQNFSIFASKTTDLSET